MKYRIARENDFEQLALLWHEAFGDSRETVRAFFDSVLSFDSTVVAEDDGKIVSMLYLIGADIVCPERSYSADYIYAAATASAYRRKGIMSELLRFAQQLCETRKVDYLFLRPANEKLYSYYEKNGFKTAFYESEAVLFDGKFDCEYRYVGWKPAVIELDRLFCEGESYTDENGYARLSTDGDDVTVNYFVSGDVGRLIEAVREKYGAVRVYWHPPCTENGCARVRTGMIKRLNPNAEAIDCAYLGITLE